MVPNLRKLPSNTEEAYDKIRLNLRGAKDVNSATIVVAKSMAEGFDIGFNNDLGRVRIDPIDEAEYAGFDKADHHREMARMVLYRSQNDLGFTQNLDLSEFEKRVEEILNKATELFERAHKRFNLLRRTAPRLLTERLMERPDTVSEELAKILGEKRGASR